MGFSPKISYRPFDLHSPGKIRQWKGFSRWQRFRALTAIVGIVGIGSLALIYFIPAPPSKVVMATAFKGASFEYYGRQYQEIFARSHVELELRESAGAVENLKLLRIQIPMYRSLSSLEAFRMQNTRLEYYR